MSEKWIYFHVIYTILYALIRRLNESELKHLLQYFKINVLENFEFWSFSLKLIFTSEISMHVQWK